MQRTGERLFGPLTAQRMNAIWRKKVRLFYIFIIMVVWKLISEIILADPRYGMDKWSSGSASGDEFWPGQQIPFSDCVYCNAC